MLLHPIATNLQSEVLIALPTVISDRIRNRQKRRLSLIATTISILLYKNVDLHAREL